MIGVTNSAVTVLPLIYIWNPIFHPDVTCTDHQFTCNEFDGQYKLCIPKTWQCDGQKDCASGEDEEKCEAKTCRPSDFT